MAKPFLAPPASSSPSSSPSSASSSPGEDSSPPANSHVKKSSADFTVSVLRKQAERSSESIDHEKRYKDDRSLSEEGSTDDESSEDPGAAVARSNPLLFTRESQNAGKQAANTFSSDLGSEDGEEDGEEEDYSSKSADQPPPPPQAAGSTARHNPAVLISGSDHPVSEDEFVNSSDSNMSEHPPGCSSHKVSDPSLIPFSSKSMDDRTQSAHNTPISGKRLATSPAQISRKKRTTDIVGAEGDQSKKEITRRIWSKEDELSLLQCILDYKENHHVIPSTPVQLKSLQKALNDSLSISVTHSQMNAKIRVLRKKYNSATKIVKCAKDQNVSNAHSAALFDLMAKIWGSNKDSYFLENKIKPELSSIKEIKGKLKPFAVEYPFLHWHLKIDHPNTALVLESHMPFAKANELEGKCQKLEKAEIQLHMKKIKLFPSALKLIEDTLVE